MKLSHELYERLRDLSPEERADALLTVVMATVRKHVESERQREAICRELLPITMSVATVWANEVGDYTRVLQDEDEHNQLMEEERQRELRDMYGDTY